MRRAGPRSTKSVFTYTPVINDRPRKTTQEQFKNRLLRNATVESTIAEDYREHQLLAQSEGLFFEEMCAG